MPPKHLEQIGFIPTRFELFVFTPGLVVFFRRNKFKALWRKMAKFCGAWSQRIWWGPRTYGTPVFQVALSFVRSLICLMNQTRKPVGLGPIETRRRRLPVAFQRQHMIPHYLVLVGAMIVMAVSITFMSRALDTKVVLALIPAILYYWHGCRCWSGMGECLRWSSGALGRRYSNCRAKSACGYCVNLAWTSSNTGTSEGEVVSLTSSIMSPAFTARERYFHRKVHGEGSGRPHPRSLSTDPN
jgi:hypothetical protein